MHCLTCTYPTVTNTRFTSWATPFRYVASHLSCRSSETTRTVMLPALCCWSGARPPTVMITAARAPPFSVHLHRIAAAHAAFRPLRCVRLPPWRLVGALTRAMHHLPWDGMVGVGGGAWAVCSEPLSPSIHTQLDRDSPLPNPDYILLRVAFH